MWTVQATVSAAFASDAGGTPATTRPIRWRIQRLSEQGTNGGDSARSLYVHSRGEFSREKGVGGTEGSNPSLTGFIERWMLDVSF
jgi:hypothetical protein